MHLVKTKCILRLQLPNLPACFCQPQPVEAGGVGAGAGVGAGVGAGAGAGAGAGSCSAEIAGMFCGELGTFAPITCENNPAVKKAVNNDVFFMFVRGNYPLQPFSTSCANERSFHERFGDIFNSAARSDIKN